MYLSVCVRARIYAVDHMQSLLLGESNDAHDETQPMAQQH